MLQTCPATVWQLRLVLSGSATQLFLLLQGAALQVMDAPFPVSGRCVLHDLLQKAKLQNATLLPLVPSAASVPLQAQL